MKDRLIDWIKVRPHLRVNSIIYFVGFAAVAICSFWSRVITERALRLLPDQDKLHLIDSFSRFRVWGALPLVVIMCAFFGSGYLTGGWAWVAIFGAWFLLTVYFVWTHIMFLRRFRERQIAEGYQCAFAKARYLFYAGLGILFFCTTIPSFLQ
jgi:hypothetical protein